MKDGFCVWWSKQSQEQCLFLPCKQNYSFHRPQLKAISVPGTGDLAVNTMDIMEFTEKLIYISSEFMTQNLE